MGGRNVSCECDVGRLSSADLRQRDVQLLHRYDHDDNHHHVDEPNYNEQSYHLEFVDQQQFDVHEHVYEFHACQLDVHFVKQQLEL